MVVVEVGILLRQPHGKSSRSRVLGPDPNLACIHTKPYYF
jgi:hypothetical protein